MLLRAINMHTLSPVPRRFKFSTDAHRQRKIPVCVGIIAVWLCSFHLLGATNSSVFRSACPESCAAAIQIFNRCTPAKKNSRLRWDYRGVVVQLSSFGGNQFVRVRLLD